MQKIQRKHGKRNRNTILDPTDVDILRTDGAIASPIRNINYRKIDIDCIQGTHNNRNGQNTKTKLRDSPLAKRGSGTNKKPINARIAIGTRNTWLNNITRIKRISNRIIAIMLRTNKESEANISITNTYVADTKYYHGDRNNYLRNLEGLIQAIPPENTILRRTDSDGKSHK